MLTHIREIIYNYIDSEQGASVFYNCRMNQLRTQNLETKFFYFVYPEFIPVAISQNPSFFEYYLKLNLALNLVTNQHKG